MKSTFLSLASLLFAGTVLVAGEMDSAFQALQSAEATNDPVQIKKAALEVYPLARAAACEPAPQNEAEKKIWTQRVEYAQYVQLHTDYALYAAAIKASPAVAVDLLATLQREDPASKYMDEAYSLYFSVLEQTGNRAKIPAVAEKGAAHFPNNPDILLQLTESAVARKQNDAALKHAKHLVAAASNRPKPEGLTAAQWDARKSWMLGRGYGVAGIAEAEKTQYFEANKDLRAAVPLLAANDPMMGASLFYLGVANYQLGRTVLNKAQIQEALKFSERAAQAKGSYSQQAWTNAQIIKTELLKMR